MPPLIHVLPQAAIVPAARIIIADLGNAWPLLMVGQKLN